MDFISALFLDAQHVNLLRDIHVAVDFDDVEIAACENSPVGNLEPWSFRYTSISKKLVFNGIFRGDKHMHAVFTMPGDDDNFYCVSYARHGRTEERVISDSSVTFKKGANTMEQQPTIINVDDLPQLTWQGVRVVTFTQLSQFFDVPVDNLKINFSRNHDRFTEGVHYFKLEGADVTMFRDMVTNCYYVPKKTARLSLFTKRGTFRLAKTLNNDRAWEIYELLESNYFDRPIVDETPGAPFWWETVPAQTRKKTQEVTDFQRGIELRKLASHTKNPELREQILLTSAFLIAGRSLLPNDK